MNEDIAASPDVDIPDTPDVETLHADHAAAFAALRGVGKGVGFVGVPAIKADRSSCLDVG